MTGLIDLNVEELQAYEYKLVLSAPQITACPKFFISTVLKHIMEDSHGEIRSNDMAKELAVE